MRLQPFNPSGQNLGWWYTYSNCAVWSNLNGLYFDNKSSPAVYWSKLRTIPEESIPKSAEMKIRPVDFFPFFFFGILTENLLSFLFLTGIVEHS